MVLAPDKRKSVCAYCGDPFEWFISDKGGHRRKYCSDECREAAKREQVRKSNKYRTGNRDEFIQPKQCKYCGEYFTPASIASVVCPKCRKATKAAWYRIPEVTHKCCDCGRPTPDHRCPECLAKWRFKNGVRGENRDEFGSDEYGKL